MNGTHFSRLNTEHWLRVKAERARRGLPGARASSGPVDHALVGLTLVERGTDRRYVVESVREDWWQGWFLTALLHDEQGSSRLCVIENRSSTHPAIERQLAQFRESFGMPH
jgi:hypothetical protein